MRWTNSAAFKRFLSGDMRRELTPESYRSWRASIPFTDAQLAQALREYGDSYKDQGFVKRHAYFEAERLERTGRFSGATLGMAMQILIKECNVCGKKALYRVGNEGRCRDHKMVQERWTQAKARRLELNSEQIGLKRTSFDTFDIANATAKKTSRVKTRRRK